MTDWEVFNDFSPICSLETPSYTTKNTRGYSMKIMVVGSSGYIGRHVVKSLATQGADVVAFDVSPAPANWTQPGVPFIQGNMANLEEVMAAVVDHGVQRIVALGYFMTPLLAPECRDLLNAARVNIHRRDESFRSRAPRASGPRRFRQHCGDVRLPRRLWARTDHREHRSRAHPKACTV